MEQNLSEQSEDFCNLNQYFLLVFLVFHAFFSTDTYTEV